ncbi:hypothetical protein GCM10010191_78480 [Actinomadura vinacea]|uniref:Uncharacterized protein n=1 Tax=Actinomadura vinacea TaxID=115336 RepID=A0ABP5XC86_9ACTN
MTELGGGTWTRAEDPFDWAAESAGRPGPGVELDLRSDGEITAERPARLFVRGGVLALATLGRDSGELVVLPSRMTAGTTRATWPFRTAGAASGWSAGHPSGSATAGSR